MGCWLKLLLFYVIVILNTQKNWITKIQGPKLWLCVIANKEMPRNIAHSFMNNILLETSIRSDF